MNCGWECLIDFEAYRSQFPQIYKEISSPLPYSEVASSKGCLFTVYGYVYLGVDLGLGKRFHLKSTAFFSVILTSCHVFKLFNLVFQ